MKPQKDSEIFTVITGASSGLGRALAFECGRRGMNLVLIALPNDNLPAVAGAIQKQFNCQVHSFELDLTDPNDFRYLIQTIRLFNINWLINNVGKGGTISFADVPESYLTEIIDLNVRTTCLLTYHLLPKLLKQRNAYILNISSLLSGYPTAFKTVYPASKSFIHSFSLGLREELRNSCISVSVAELGPMLTNGDVSCRILQRQKRGAKMAVMMTEKVAKIVLDKTLEKRGIIVPGLFNKIYWTLMKIIPYRFGIPYLSGIYLREKTIGVESASDYVIDPHKLVAS